MSTKVNFQIEQGTDIIVNINLSGVDALDLTNYTARSQFRRHYYSNNYHEFDANVTDSNTITLSMSAVDSANVDAGRYVYDVEIISPANSVTRIVEGIITVSPEATKS